VNITLDTNRHRGMVRFDTVEEANTAYASPESVCGNRFIQVKWANDRRSQQQRQNAPQVPSPFPPALKTPTAPLLPTPTTPTNESAAVSPAAASPVLPKPLPIRTIVPVKKEQSAAAKSLAIEQLRRQLIQKQIQTQKTLFANFEATKHTLSAEAKAEMLARLNKLNDTLGESLKQASQASEAVGEAVGITRSTPVPEDKRAELDKELDQMISQGHHVPKKKRFLINGLDKAEQERDFLLERRGGARDRTRCLFSLVFVVMCTFVLGSRYAVLRCW